MARKLTDRQIAAARQLRSEGAIYQAITSAVGAPLSTIYTALNPATVERNLLRSKEWNKDHKKEIRLHTVEWRKTHKNEHLLHNAKYRGLHRKQLRSYSAKYRKTHLSQYNAWQNARRALVIGATIGNLAEIKEIYRKTKEDSRIRCYLCGKLIPKGHRHVDHIVPLSRGGAHRPSNLAAACDECNRSKNAKLPKEIGILL